MRTVVAALTGSLALAMGACGGATEDDLAAIDAVTDKAGFSVGLIKSGSGEKVELRVPAEIGLEQTLRTTLSQRIKFKVAGATQTVETSSSQRNTLRITAVEGDEIVVESTLDSAEIDTGEDGAAADFGDALADALVGQVSTQRWTDRGAIISADMPDFDVDVPAGLGVSSQQFNDLMNQMMTSMEDSAQSMGVPTPVEPVGVGSSWVATAKLSMLGMPMKISTTVTVTDISDHSVTGDIDQTLTFIPGDIEIQGQSVTIDDGDMDCDGTITYLREGGVTPLVELDCDGSTKMKANGVTIKQELSMTQSTKSA